MWWGPVSWIAKIATMVDLIMKSFTFPKEWSNAKVCAWTERKHNKTHLFWNQNGTQWTVMFVPNYFHFWGSSPGKQTLTWSVQHGKNAIQRNSHPHPLHVSAWIFKSICFCEQPCLVDNQPSFKTQSKPESRDSTPPLGPPDAISGTVSFGTQSSHEGPQAEYKPVFCFHAILFQKQTSHPWGNWPGVRLWIGR